MWSLSDKRESHTVPQNNAFFLHLKTEALAEYTALLQALQKFQDVNRTHAITFR